MAPVVISLTTQPNIAAHGKPHALRPPAAIPKRLPVHPGVGVVACASAAMSPNALEELPAILRSSSSSRRSNNDIMIANMLFEMEAANAADTRLVEEAPSYPCIDLTAWLDTQAPAEARQQVVDEVVQAAVNRGAFNIRGHGVPVELLDSLSACSRAFFLLPDEDKDAVRMVCGRPSGYSAVGRESTSKMYNGGKGVHAPDYRESYSMAFPTDRRPNIITTQPPDLVGLMEEYGTHMGRLDGSLQQLLVAALQQASGMPIDPGYLGRLLDSSDNNGGLLRLSRYQSQRTEVQLKGHCDWSTLTILYAPEPGLEELYDGRWTALPPATAHELHINLGDMMQIWSNGRFKSNIHRVRCGAAAPRSSSSAVTSRCAIADRHSIAYFCAQGFSAKTEIEAKQGEKLVPVCGPGEQPLYEAVTPKEYVWNMLQRYLV